MEKKYFYIYTSDDEFIPAIQLIESVINGEWRQTVIMEDGTVKDVSKIFCYGSLLTEEEAERTIKYYRKTRFWPGEMPPEYEAEFME